MYGLGVLGDNFSISGQDPECPPGQCVVAMTDSWPTPGIICGTPCPENTRTPGRVLPENAIDPTWGIVPREPTTGLSPPAPTTPVELTGPILPDYVPPPGAGIIPGFDWTSWTPWLLGGAVAVGLAVWVWRR